MATILWVLLIVCSVVASPLQVAAQSPVQISGSTTVNLNVFQPFQAQIETASGVKLKVIANSSSHGLEDLIAGRVDVAMLSSPLTAVAGKINQKQPGAVDTSTLKEFKIGESRVAFVVHPTNPVKKGCVDLQAVRQSPLPRLRAFDNCENEGVYQRRLAYAGFACHAYHLAAYITLPHQLGDRE